MKSMTKTVSLLLLGVAALGLFAGSAAAAGRAGDDFTALGGLTAEALTPAEMESICGRAATLAQAEAAYTVALARLVELRPKSMPPARVDHFNAMWEKVKARLALRGLR